MEHSSHGHLSLREGGWIRGLFGGGWWDITADCILRSDVDGLYSDMF